MKSHSMKSHSMKSGMHWHIRCPVARPKEWVRRWGQAPCRPAHRPLLAPPQHHPQYTCIPPHATSLRRKAGGGSEERLWTDLAKPIKCARAGSAVQQMPKNKLLTMEHRARGWHGNTEGGRPCPAVSRLYCRCCLIPCSARGRRQQGCTCQPSPPDPLQRTTASAAGAGAGTGGSRGGGRGGDSSLRACKAEQGCRWAGALRERSVCTGRQVLLRWCVWKGLRRPGRMHPQLRPALCTQRAQRTGSRPSLHC